MPVTPSEIPLPPRCEVCGATTARIGKLPRIGLRPLVYVYKCEPCNHITSVELMSSKTDAAIARAVRAARTKTHPDGSGRRKGSRSGNA